MSAINPFAARAEGLRELAMMAIEWAVFWDHRAVTWELADADNRARLDREFTEAFS